MSGMKKKNIQTEIKTLQEQSEVEITVTVSADTLDMAIASEWDNIAKNAKIDGFRKGHVPRAVLEKNFSEASVLDKAAQAVVREVYPGIIIENDIKAVGSPMINITKLAKGNDLEFVVTVAVMPEFTLPDYKKIAKKEFSAKADTKVTKKDVEDVIKQVQRQRVQIEAIEKQKADGVEQPKVPQLHEIKDEELKPLDDAFVQTLGDFKTVDDFKKKIEENIAEEKKLKDIEKKRIATIEAIVAKTDIVIPRILAEYELDRIQSQFEADIAQTGTKVADYLTQINKTMDEMRASWKEDAEKRAKLQLILNKLADEHNIEPSKEAVDKEVQHLLAHYKDAKEDNVRVYVETMLTNEMVLKFLEELAGK